MNQKTWLKMKDKERWKWIQEHQGEGFIIILDNDQTYMYDQTCPEDAEPSDYCYDFDYYIGWSDGVQILLDAMGIEYSEA